MSTRIRVNGADLPMSQTVGNDITPSPIEPFEIDWGKTTPWGAHAATTLSVSLHARKRGWPSDRMVGRPVHVIDDRLPLPVFAGVITKIDAEEKTNGILYKLEASDMFYALDRDTVKPTGIGHMADGTVGRFERAAQSCGLDGYELGTDMVDRNDYLQAYMSAFTTGDAQADYGKHLIESCSSIGDYLDGWHVAEGQYNDNKTTTPYAGVSLWDYPYIIPKRRITVSGVNTLAYVGTATGTTRRRLDMFYSGSNANINLRDNIPYGGGADSMILSAGLCRIDSPQLGSVQTYRRVTLKSWVKNTAKNTYEQTGTTTAATGDYDGSLFNDVLSLAAKDTVKAGDTARIFTGNGGYKNVTISAAPMHAELDEMRTRPPLPDVTISLQQLANSMSGNTYETWFFTTAPTSLTIIGSKYERTAPETHGRWIPVKGKLTYKNGDWTHTLTLWPLQSDTTSPSVAAFKRSTVAAHAYNTCHVNRSYSQNDSYPTVTVGALRYVNTFDQFN